MATWDTSQFNFMAQTADQMADNRFQRLAQEQAENERRFRRDLAEQEANHRFNMDMNRDQREERKFNQAYEIAAAAENRAAEQFRQNMSDAQAAAERAAAAERRTQTAWEQSQAAARQQREQEDLTRRYNAAQHSPLAQAYYRLSAGDNFADLTPAQQQALRTGITTSTNGSVGTSDEAIVQYYRSLRPEDLIRHGIVPEYAEEYRRRRVADPHLEQTRANQAAALAAQRQQLADAELARQFAGLSNEQKAAAYLRAGKKYNDLPPELQQIVLNGATAGNKVLSKGAIADWLNGQPELDNQTAFTALINRQGQGRFTYAPSAPPSSGQRPTPAAGSSERSQSRPAPSGGQQQGGSTPEPLSENQSTAVYAYEKLHQHKDNISNTDPLNWLDDKEKAAFIRVFGNGAENLTADQVREILNNPYAFSVLGSQYASGNARNRILANIPQAIAARKSQQPAAQEETVQQRFTHLSNDQQQALMAFMAMRENHVPFESLPPEQQAAFRKVFMPDGQTRFKLQTGEGENNLKPGETATPQVTATPEDIAASGDLTPVFGLQTKDVMQENADAARSQYNSPESSQARVMQFINNLSNDDKLALQAFAAIRNGVKLSDLPQNYRTAFFKKYNNDNQFTSDNAASEYVQDLNNFAQLPASERQAVLTWSQQQYATASEARKTETTRLEQEQRNHRLAQIKGAIETALITESTDINGKKTVERPSEEQINSVASLVLDYGIPLQSALEIYRNPQIFSSVMQLPSDSYRFLYGKYGDNFAGLSYETKVALIFLTQDIARRLANGEDIANLQNAWQNGIATITDHGLHLPRNNFQFPFDSNNPDKNRFTYRP